MSLAARERALKDVPAERVAQAERRRAAYRAQGVELPLLEALALDGSVSSDALEAAVRGEEIPSRIAGLDVVRAAGGTAERPVYLARRALDGETFLVHALLRARSDAPTEVDHFVRAMEDGRRLSGPGWIRVLEAGGADGAYAAVLPVPDGMRLDERLAQRGHLSPSEAVGVVRRIADALWQLEALGRAATFPEPALVLVDREGRVALVALEILLAVRAGAFDPRDFARSAAHFLARLVGPEQVADPAVRGLLADLSSGRYEVLRATSPPPAPADLPSIELDTPVLVPTPPGARPTPRTATTPDAARRPSRLTIALALLGAAAAVAVVVALSRSRPMPTPPDDASHAGSREARRAPAAGVEPATSASGATRAEPIRDEGLTALEAALAYLADERSSDPQGVLDRLRAVEARYGGSEAGHRATLERERFHREVEEEAERRVTGIAADVERLLAAEELGPALAAIDTFPRRLGFTRAVVRLDGLRASVRARAETVYAGLRPSLDAAADPARRDAAEAALARVRALGDRELTARATQRMADAVARGAGLVSRRQELAGDLARVVGEALATAGGGDVDRARRVLDAAARTPLHDVYGERLGAARDAVERILRVFEAATSEWRARTGRSAQVLLREFDARPFVVTPTDAAGDRLSYTRGGAPGAVRLGQLDPETIASLAVSGGPTTGATGGREGDPDLSLGVATLLAATGRLAEAEAAAERAAMLGAAWPHREAECAAVRAHLEAVARRELAAADAALARQRDTARAGYFKAATTAPFLPLPHRRLAAWWSEEKRPEEALAAWRRALALGDASADVRHGIARSATAAGRPDDEVLDAWRAFQAGAPGDDPRLAEARAETERLESKATRHGTLERLKAAKALLDAGKTAEAVAALEEAIAADPGSLEARRALARAAEKADDPLRAYLGWRDAHARATTTRDATEAKEQAERLLRAHGERPAQATVRRAGETAVERGEFAAGVESFRRAVTMAALDPEARLGLGGALLGLAARTGAKGLVDEALAAYDVAVTLAPSDARALSGRAELRRWKGDFDGAVADATAAIARRKDYYPAYNTRGLSHYQSLRFDAALADLDVVCTLAPTMATPRITRAGILLAMNRLDDAEADLKTARERTPSDAERSQIEALAAQLAARKGSR